MNSTSSETSVSREDMASFINILRKNYEALHSYQKGQGNTVNCDSDYIFWAKSCSSCPWGKCGGECKKCNNMCISFLDTCWAQYDGIIRKQYTSTLPTTMKVNSYKTEFTESHHHGVENQSSINVLGETVYLL